MSRAALQFRAQQRRPRNSGKEQRKQSADFTDYADSKNGRKQLSFSFSDLRNLRNLRIIPPFALSP